MIEEKNQEMKNDKSAAVKLDEAKPVNVAESKEVKQNTKPVEQQKDSKKEEVKTDKKPVSKVQKVKKEEAVARGTNLPASKKHCMYICRFIKNKPIDLALSELQSVIAMKRPIPFKGEIPHRSFPGMMSGRYPVNASKQFINMLKALKGNVLVNGLDLDKTRIYFASATWDSRPARKGGTRFKRAHVLLKAKEFNNQPKEIKK